MKIELNQNEAQVLLSLIDIAVKATGIPAAEAGLHFSRLIAEAIKTEQSEKPELTLTEAA